MKKAYFIILLLTNIILSSCNSDSIDTENSIFSTEEIERNTFDKWLLNNYIYPYNIEVKYRLEDIESSMGYILAPATYEKSVVLMKIVKHVWLEAYDEIAGIDFMRTYVPRTMLLVGSAAYNENGTIVLGTAEGGMKITLFNVNDLDLNNINIDLLYEYYFRTMHH